jgi:hypothetical protein
MTMNRFQMTQDRVDAAVRVQSAALVLLVLGWTLFGMAGLVGIYVFSAFRDGDAVWPAYTGIMGFIGLVLLFAGWWRRTSAE